MTKMTSLLKCSALCFVAMSASAMAADVTMTFGHAAAASDISDDHVAVLSFKAFVEAESNGEIEVQVFPAQQLGSAREMAEAISAGTLDAANVPIVFLSSFIPELSIVELPYLLEGHDHAEKFAAGPIKDFLSEKISEAIPNVGVASLANSGNFRSFYTTKEVKSVADLASLKIRTVPSPLAIEFVTSLGAEAVPLSWGDVYPSLQSGLIQGTKNSAIDIIPSKMDEVAKFGIIDQHAYLLAGNLVSQSFMAGLSDAHRDVVQRGFEEMSRVQTAFNVGYEAKGREEFESNGGKIHYPTPEEKAGFSAVREHMIEWYINEYGDSGKAWADRFIAEAEAAKP